MKVEQHFAIQSLRAEATKKFLGLEAELDRTRRELADLNSDTAKKKYAADFLRSQIDQTKRKAKEIASVERADIFNLGKRVEKAREVWQTERLMRGARLTNEGDSVEAQLLGEMRRLRLMNEFQTATPAELLQSIADARESNNLALLAMIRRETARRSFENDGEAAAVKVAIAAAIDGVEIEGANSAPNWTLIPPQTGQ